MLRKNFQAEYSDAIEGRDPLCVMKPQEDLPVSPLRMWTGDLGMWQSRQERWGRQAVVPHPMLHTLLPASVGHTGRWADEDLLSPSDWGCPAEMLAWASANCTCTGPPEQT